MNFKKFFGKSDAQLSEKYQDWLEKVDPDVKNDKIKLIEYLWDEYKYRHEHCWNLTFKFTLSVVALGIIPYIKPEIVEDLEYWTIIPPGLSIFLSLPGLMQLSRELNLLNHIRNLYWP